MSLLYLLSSLTSRPSTQATDTLGAARCDKLRPRCEPGNRLLEVPIIRSRALARPETVRQNETIMHVIPPVRVKVSCLRSAEEARRAVSFGVEAIGVASGLPAPAQELTDEEIAVIAAAVGEEVGTFLLTGLEDVDEIVEKVRRCGVNTVQLWDVLPRDSYRKIRRALPGVSIAQSVHVTGEAAIDQAREMATVADALVLGSTNPEPPFRWSDPHGQTHDWEISRRIVKAAQVPVILSGGLTHRNVADAIRLVRPYGVEVCSGVRRAGALETSMLVQFLESLDRLRPF
jgi:phosphoribosylanthranilate isomerase